LKATVKRLNDLPLPGIGALAAIDGAWIADLAISARSAESRVSINAVGQVFVVDHAVITVV
jgi:hypothetical protein